jgi:RHS repeat-associated protein
MPNRNVTGDYRYNYQGQEKDSETGKEAFQLRLYDSRINRWLTTDPAGQHHSPYLSMSNNWVSVVDPDGGCDDGKGNLIPCPKGGGGMAHQLDEVVIHAKGGNSPRMSSMDMSFMNNLPDWQSQSLKLANTRDFHNMISERSSQVKTFSEHPITQMVLMAIMSPGVGGGASLINGGLKTTPTGFLGGSIAFRTPFAMRVGLYASKGTVKSGTFYWSTIAPHGLAKFQSFGRTGLQITKDFQPVLGTWTKQIIPKGTLIDVGLTGHQSGQKFGTWLQLYAREGIPFIK